MADYFLFKMRGGICEFMTRSCELFYLGKRKREDCKLLWKSKEKEEDGDGAWRGTRKEGGEEEGFVN